MENDLVALRGTADGVAYVGKVGPLDRSEVSLDQHAHQNILVRVPAVVGLIGVDFIPDTLKDGALMVIPGDAVTQDGQVRFQPAVIDGHLV